MRIKMLTLAADEHQVLERGREYSVSRPFGDALVDGSYAVEVLVTEAAGPDAPAAAKPQAAPKPRAPRQPSKPKG